MGAGLPASRAGSSRAGSIEEVTSTDVWVEPAAFGRCTRLDSAEDGVAVNVGVGVTDGLDVGDGDGDVGDGDGVAATVATPKSMTLMAFFPSRLTLMAGAEVSCWPAGGAAVIVYRPDGRSSKV